MLNFPRSLPAESKPVQLPQDLQLARKPKVQPPALTNGVVNGHHAVEKSTTKRKRSLEPDVDPQQVSKRGKLEDGWGDDAVVIDDGNDGAIMIDDD